MQLMKELQQAVEHGSHISQPGFNVVLDPVEDLLGIADGGEQGKGRFHRHSVVPGAFLADFDVGWNPLRTPKAP